MKTKNEKRQDMLLELIEELREENRALSRINGELFKENNCLRSRIERLERERITYTVEPYNTL